MPLENKGLASIRKYDTKKTVDSLESALCGTVAVLGSIGTFLYFTDLFRNGNTEGGLGMSWQPSWTPGYEINHNGALGLGDLAYLGGYLGATCLGVKAVKKIAQPIAQKWKAWRHESSGEKVRDEEFTENYTTLADRLLSGEPILSGLHQDYKDSLQLDLLTHYLSNNSAEGKAIATDLSQRRAGLVASVVKEHMIKLDYEPATLSPYIQLLSVQDLVDLGTHYVESGRFDQAENFIADHLNKIKPDENSYKIQPRILYMREKIAEEFYHAG